MSLLNTPICEFGTPAPDFSLKTPSGEVHSPQSAVGKNGLLIAFICNHCPYVIAIAERLASDAKVLQAEGIGVLAIMSNDYQTYAADSPENMVRFAQQYGFGSLIWSMNRKRLQRHMMLSAHRISLDITTG